MCHEPRKSLSFLLCFFLLKQKSPLKSVSSLSEDHVWDNRSTSLLGYVNVRPHTGVVAEGGALLTRWTCLARSDT